ncbi:MAG: MFS transporter [Elusimicrobiota bacterium]
MQGDPARPEQQRGLRNFLLESVTGQVLVSLTSGTFVTAFAVKLGASNAQIGILAAIAALSQLLQVPAVYLINRLQDRKPIAAVGFALSKLSWLLIVVPVLFGARSVPMGLLTATVACSSAFAAVALCTRNSWLRDVIGQDQMGAFFAKRLAYSKAVGIFTGLAAGIFVTVWAKYSRETLLSSYAILFSAGILCGLMSVYFVWTSPEPPRIPIDVKFLSSLLEPFRDRNYRMLIIFLAMWSFSVNLAAPFFTVYMLQRLHFTVAFVMALAVLSNVMNLIFFRFWGAFADQFSNKGVLAVCAPLCIICTLSWAFTTLPEPHFLTLPMVVAIHVVVGAASAGVILASSNIGMKLSPRAKSASFLAASSIVSSLAAGVAPIIGGLSADYFASRELSLLLTWKSPELDFGLRAISFRHWDFFFAIAFVLGLYSLRRLSLVQEEGEVQRKVALREFLQRLRANMLALTTVRGVRQFILLPVESLRDFTDDDDILPHARREGAAK